MVLSEYRKRLEKIFQNTVISSISQNDKSYRNIFPPPFFSILKEPLIVRNKRYLKKRSDTQLFLARKFEGVAQSGGLHAHLSQKDIEKKVNLTEERKSGRKKKIF